MQFEYTEPQDDMERLFGGFFCINAIGRINRGDCDKFLEFLQKTNPPPRCPVYINSEGGSVSDAIRMGLLIRGGWFSTNVGSYVLAKEDSTEQITRRTFNHGRCMSAATLMYLGGRLRYLEANCRFGVHQFSYRGSRTDDIGNAQVLSAEIAQFLSEMEITPKFLELSAATPSSTIALLDHTELRELGVVTDGQTRPVWSTKSRNKMLYVRGERDSLYGHHKVMLGFNRDIGFLFWAVIEAQGRESELAEFGFVEIVINGEETKIDISGRCSREVVGIYVNVFAKLSPAEARAIAQSKSFGVHIRMSREAGIHLGIAAMSTEGGEDQLQTLLENVG